MLRRIFLSVLLVAIAFPNLAMGQAGVSSMSFGAARNGIHRIGPNGSYRMPLPTMLRIEEFINYHRHELPLPSQGQRVRLDVQRLRLDDGKTVFQFGITTPRALDPDKLPPMNVVLVIDRSGSMSGGKLENVKKAIHAFVERFRKSDKVSIVLFDHNATLHMDAMEKTRIDVIAKAIDAIAIGGSTNLHAGLMLGYEQALKHFDAERTNRVIFLTDGNANVGVTESEEIARQSKACNKQGISLTTIGLGVDFNSGLLRQLADAGLGSIHYVGDSKDIQKIFVDEVDSLLAPAARKVKLTLDFGKAAAKTKIYGYHSEQKDNRFVFELDDLNHGATQVVMARTGRSVSDPNPTATLRYLDAISGEKVEIRQGLAEMVARTDGREASISINRNYSIALVAKSIRSAAEASEAGDCEKAAERLAKGMKKAKARIENDEHVDRVVKIAAEYHKCILECIARNRD